MWWLRFKCVFWYGLYDRSSKASDLLFFKECFLYYLNQICQLCNLWQVNWNAARVQNLNQAWGWQTLFILLFMQISKSNCLAWELLMKLVWFFHPSLDRKDLGCMDSKGTVSKMSYLTGLSECIAGAWGTSYYSVIAVTFQCPVMDFISLEWNSASGMPKIPQGNFCCLPFPHKLLFNFMWLNLVTFSAH